MGSIRSHLLAAVALAGIVATSSVHGQEVGITDTTIRLGMFGPLTGAVSIYGYPINNGAIAVYQEINAQGGINGRKIEIVHEDGSCDPAKTRAAVKKLIENDKVFAVHGGAATTGRGQRGEGRVHQRQGAVHGDGGDARRNLRSAEPLPVHDDAAGQRRRPRDDGFHEVDPEREEDRDRPPPERLGQREDEEHR